MLILKGIFLEIRCVIFLPVVHLQTAFVCVLCWGEDVKSVFDRLWTSHPFSFSSSVRLWYYSWFSSEVSFVLLPARVNGPSQWVLFEYIHTLWCQPYYHWEKCLIICVINWIWGSLRLCGLDFYLFLWGKKSCMKTLSSSLSSFFIEVTGKIFILEKNHH